MFAYQIIPTDGEDLPTEIIAYDAAGVMGIVSRFDCQEADILRDGAYSFSLKLGEHGVWQVFKRELAAAPSRLRAAG